MKVALKLILWFILSVIVIEAVDVVLAVRRQTDLFQAEMRHDALMLGYTMKDLVTDVWSAYGQERALALIGDANREGQRIRVRWVWLDAKEDQYQSQIAQSRLLETLQGNTSVSLTAANDRGRFLYTYVPVEVGDSRTGALELSESMSHLENYTRSTWMRSGVLAGAFVICGAVAASIFGIRIIGRPLDRITAKLRRIGEGDLSSPLQLKRRDEFGTLADVLDKMCNDLVVTQRRLESETAARIKTLEELRHADRLSTVGRLSAGVAHELGTPLNVVAERARIIQEESGKDGEVGISAHIIEQQSGHMADIVRQLLDFSRRRPSEKTITDLRELARETVDMLRALAEKRQVRLHLEASQQCVNCFVFKRQIRQVLINLIDNAVEASSLDGEVRIQVARATIQSPPKQHAISGDYVRLDILDHGSGILTDDMERIFEPFFTTKDIGEGTGLGLSIAYSIVEEHGGWIDVSSGMDGGTCFSVYVPVHTPPARNADPCGASGGLKGSETRQEFRRLA